MAAPTNAPSFVASAAACLAVGEVERLRAGEVSLAVGGEVMLDLRNHTHHVSRLERNPDCRFDHAEPWRIEAVRDLRVGEALGLAGRGAASLRVEETAFVSRLSCQACGCVEAPWRLQARLDVEALACPRCGSPRVVRGIDLVGELAAADAPAGVLDRRLTQLGLRPGDIFAVEGPSGPAHFEIECAGVPGAASPEAPGVLLAGCGAIGSFAAQLFPRLRELRSVSLCDKDIYEPRQERGQSIEPGDVTRRKVSVQAEKLRRIDPALAVRIFPIPLEDLPLGELRHRIVVGALDSQLARMRLARKAWRVGAPYVDVACDGEGWLARVDVYRPEPAGPCYECAMEPESYQQLEQIHACDGSREERS